MAALFKNLFKSSDMGTKIKVEGSPNPNSLKFILDREVVPNDMAIDFANKTMASQGDFASPFVADLYLFDFVDRVFLASDFITITKKDQVEWDDVLVDVFDFIKKYFDEGHPVFTTPPQPIDSLYIGESDSPTVVSIKKALEQYVKPAVENDGGFIGFSSFDEITGKVIVTLQGACSGCPSASLTLKSGIERLLTTMVPEVRLVEAEEI